MPTPDRRVRVFVLRYGDGLFAAVALCLQRTLKNKNDRGLFVPDVMATLGATPGQAVDNLEELFRISPAVLPDSAWEDAEMTLGLPTLPVT